MTIPVFVIKFRDTGKLAATGDVVLGATIDVFMNRYDAEFIARTVYAGRQLEVRRASLEVQ